MDIARLLWLREDKLNAHGLAPISLRITVAGKRAEISTGVRCKPSDWTGCKGQKGTLKRSHPEYDADTDTLEDYYHSAKIAKSRLEALGLAVTAAAVAALLKNPKVLQPGPAPCLLDFMETELETHYLPANRATYEAARAVVRKLRAWHGASRLPLDALTPVRAQAFYRGLLGATARGGEIATANKALAWLNGLFRRGIKQALWSEAQNPFACITKKAALKRQKVRLTKPELQAVLAVPLEYGGWLCRARVAFLVQFYLRGERLGAVLLLRWTDVQQQGTVIRYQAQKNGPFKQVPARPELKALLGQLAERRAAGSPFVLAYLPANYDKLDAHGQLDAVKASTAVINKALKEVARLAGVDKPLRSHAARHTFATVAAKAVGARAVQQFLGHTTLKMTETYLADLDTDELDSAGNTAFDSLLL